MSTHEIVSALAYPCVVCCVWCRLASSPEQTCAKGPPRPVPVGSAATSGGEVRGDSTDAAVRAQAMKVPTPSTNHRSGPPAAAVGRLLQGNNHHVQVAVSLFTPEWSNRPWCWPGRVVGGHRLFVGLINLVCRHWRADHSGPAEVTDTTD